MAHIPSSESRFLIGWHSGPRTDAPLLICGRNVFLMARVTNHAARRTKERLGLPKKLSHKNAENALRYGIRHSDTSGSLNRYISALYWKHETANNVRIYCNNVYIFHGETLITIFPLPQKYRKTAARINRKTTERGEFDENS